MKRTWSGLVTGVTLTLTLAGQALADEGKITVFAAASLTNAMQDIAAVYKKEKNVDVVSSFASSSTLARQIEAGAPADLFISADQKWMDYAVDKKAVDAASRVTLLGNSLVVVAPKASAQGEVAINKETPWSSLLKGGVWRWAIRNTFRQAFTLKRRCKNWVPGRRWLLNLRLRKMCAARWRWWRAMKRRLGSSTVPMRLLKKG